MRPLLRLSRRQLARHPWQLASAVFGVALGVAVVIAIDLANASASRAFELSTEAVTGRATHGLVGGGAGVPDELYRRLRVELGWTSCAPVVEGVARLELAGPVPSGADAADESLDPSWVPDSGASPAGRAARPVQVLGVDPFAEGPFRPSIAAEIGGFDGLAEFMAEPDAVVLEASTAARLGWAVGDSARLVVDGRERPVRLVGTLDVDDELVVRGLENVLVCDVGTAQVLLDRPGRLTRIDLILAPEDEAELLAELEPLLPPDVLVEPAASRKELVGRMTRAFRTNLQAMSLLALIVGMFLIYNTMQFSIVQRRRLIGRLRALGATRGQIFASVVVEALALGGVGTVLGLALGTLLARGLVRLVVQSINDLYFSLSVSGLDLAWPVFLKAGVLGILAALGASLVPALEAANTEPRNAMERSHLERRAHGLLLRAAIFGVLLGIVGAIALALPVRGLAVAYLGLFGVLVAAACFTPIVVLFTARGLVRLLPRRAPVELRLALTGMDRNLSRTAVAIAALVLAVSVTVGVGIMISSFRVSVDRWLTASLQSDVFVSAPTYGARRVAPPLDARLVEELQALDGVESSSLLRRTFTHTRCGETAVLSLLPGSRTQATFDFLSGDSDEIWGRFVSGEAVIVSEPLSYRCGLAPGDELELVGPAASRRLPVAGIFYDYATEAGTAIVHHDLATELFGDAVVSSLSLDLADGVDADEVVDRARLAAAGLQEVFVWSNRSLREASLEVFDRTFAITTVLRLLAAGVAFLGVLGALFALELDRLREFSILRAVGATPGQVRRMVIGETALFGLFAGLLSLPVGGLLAWILIHVINRRSFGWTLLEGRVSASVLLEALGLALLAALLAGIFPALSAGRSEPAQALREE